MSEREMDSTVQGDLAINNLIYRQPKALSLATHRTMKRQFFQRSSYSAGETAVIDLNTGSDYMNCANSYLTFTVTLTGTTPVGGFGVGSAANVVQMITVRSRSGTEVDRVERANLVAAREMHHTVGSDYLTKFGTVMGAQGTATILSSTATRYCIPLRLIAGIFRPTGGQHLPPHLASGLHIELLLADYREAIFANSGTVTGYTLGDMAIMCDLVSLSDSTQKTLNMESQSGLEYTYPRTYVSTSTVSSTAVNVQVRKAVSQASIAYATFLLQSSVLDVSVDSFKAVAFNVDSWQYRLGSLYFPNSAIKSASDGVESFMIAQTVYDKVKHPHSENAVSLTDFTTNGHGILAVSLEKDQSLNLSGVPMNNSRILELEATLASWSANLECVICLEYQCVSRCFLDNTATAI